MGQGLLSYVKGVSRNLLCVIHAELGTEHFLPRINAIFDGNETTFNWQRRQFPVRVAFTMTINRSQGQTVRGKCGVFLPESVFSHGQLYIALSRTVLQTQII